MSDIAPLQSMIPPGSSSPAYPELRYNDAGNSYACNDAGAWVPHPGICKAITTSRPSFRIEHGEPQLSLSCEPPGTHALRTPATFKSNEDTPLLPSGYCTALCQVPTNMIDPAFLPLPDFGDLDLTNDVTIAEAHGHTPAVKTAGSHRQVKGLRGKGKTKENFTSANSKKCSREDVDEDDEAHAQQGRPQGSNNYTMSDVTILLDMVRQEFPLGQCGWQVVHVKFCQWAKANGRPERKVTSLKTKFKQLVKTMKPMGDSVCPPDVTRALRIDQLINERAGTRDLDDMDFDAIEDDINRSVVSDEIDIQDEPYRTSPPIQHTAVARSTARTDAPVPCRNARGAAATDLLTRLSGAFDPAAQRSRDEECANRSLATVQLLTQSQQLRDSQASVENLHGQLFGLRTRLYDAERECDRAQLRIEIMEMSGSTRRRHIQMPRCKNLHQEWYPEGGGSVRWMTDEGESTASEAPKPPRLQRCGPSGRRKYSDHPYFEDLADEPYKPIQKEGSQDI